MRTKSDILIILDVQGELDLVHWRRYWGYLLYFGNS